MYGHEAAQLNSTLLQAKKELAAVRKQTEESGPTTAALLTLIGIIGSLSDVIRQICLAGDRHESAHR